MDKQKRVRVSKDQILDLFQTFSVLTADQIGNLLGVNTLYSIRTQLNQMSIQKEMPPISSRNIARPWVGTHSNLAFFLTEYGARIVSERHDIRVVAPKGTTLRKNFVHGLALTDIGIALNSLGAPFQIEKRVILNEDTDEFIRPDVLCLHDDKRHLIELEQSRSEQDLDVRLLGRLRRWQKAFTSPEMEDVSSDVIVLFSIKKDDKHTVAVWMKVLNQLQDELGGPAAFSVYALELSTFLKSPTLDLRKFRLLAPSDFPEAAMLASERERFFEREISTRIDAAGMQSALDKTKSFYINYRGKLQAITRTNTERCSFLDHVDQLYMMSEFGEYAGAVPWLGISLVRYWLEQPIYIAFRLELIDAIERLKSSYARGTNTAAETMERMVWTVLLRRFGFARGGPLTFLPQIGSNERDKNPRTGLIPVFSISTPWAGIRETEIAAETTCRSLTWLVDLLVDFQEELGLTRESKKAASVAALDPPNIVEEESSWEQS